MIISLVEGIMGSGQSVYQVRDENGNNLIADARLGWRIVPVDYWWRYVDAKRIFDLIQEEVAAIKKAEKDNQVGIDVVVIRTAEV